MDSHYVQYRLASANDTGPTMENNATRPRALLSVYDKTNIVEFATGLARLGFELVSTGGTAKKLKQAGLEVIGVSDITGHPEIFDGRVKSLHPAIHGPLLARLESEADRVGLDELGYAPIQIVACNLYPLKPAQQLHHTRSFSSCWSTSISPLGANAERTLANTVFVGSETTELLAVLIRICGKTRCLA